MGKKLVIKGADFSENGFVYEIVKKEITSLYDKEGNLVTQSSEYLSANGWYYYEQTVDGVLKNTGYNNASTIALCTTQKSGGGDVFVDVEDYTDAEIITRCNLGPVSIIAGVAVLFFLDSTYNIIGGFSTGDSLDGCVNVGASDTLRTFRQKVPAGCKYCVASVFTSSANAATIFDDFKITLSKKVITA